MSLRLRLTLLIASVFLSLWLISSIWLITGLRSELDSALDQRLQATATMLSNILATVPENALGSTLPSVLQGNELGNARGLSCLISTIHGTVIASSNSGSLSIGAAAEQISGFALLNSENVQWRTYTLRTNKFIITIADKISERESLHFNLLKTTLIPPAIALVASLALLWIAVGRGLLPIRKLALAVEKRGSDDLSPVYLDKPSLELQPLVASQNALMARLAEGMRREQQFTNNAAHELRTPLAGILAQIQVAELLADEGKEKALVQAKRSAQRLHKILDNLLALARVESVIAQNPVAPWSLASMVKSIEQDISQDAQRIKTKIAEDREITFIALPLIDIVCRNLLENALKYSEANSFVTLEAESSIRGIKIAVKNSGNICAEDISQMTSRFWRKGETKGAGLGLSIVKAIASKYQGSLELENQGASFVVTFSITI